MSITDLVRERSIAEALHFTTNEGLVGILASGYVLSRKRLPKEKYVEHVYSPNCETRRDLAWLDYVNLSISKVNTRLLDISSGKWHVNREVWWCVLAFDPVTLSHDGVYFSTTNNFYSGVSQAAGVSGFESLFADRVVQYTDFNGRPVRYASRTSDTPTNMPTCPQAEVLYPEQLSVEFLRTIYVQNEDHADVAASQRDLFLDQGVDVTVAPSVFR